MELNDIVNDLEGIIVFIETFFERLEHEKMDIEEPIGILRHVLSMLNRKKESWKNKMENMGNLEEKLEDLKCPNCGAYLSFKTVIDNKRFNVKTQCGKCLEELTINIEIKKIQGRE